MNSAATGNRTDVYGRLGVRKVINAFETISIAGGTRTRSEVLDAMRQASHDFVFLPELHEKVGDRIAELTRNEGAAVTNGASAGLLLATAACLESRMPGMAHRLPTGAGDHKVLVQRCQYSPYVPNIRQSGAGIVEVGYAQHHTPAEVLEAAVDQHVAAILYTAGAPFERFAIPLERVIAIARRHEVPVIVDAAALVPPVENLWRYTALGADLVVFSGGKGLRGPQDSGAVVGKRRLTDIVLRLNSPNHGIGRALKSSKEDVVGFLVALELALEEDEAGRYAALCEQGDRVLQALAGTAGIEASMLPAGRQGQPCPRVVVRLLPTSGWERPAFMQALRDGEPAVVVGDLDEDRSSFYVNPLSLTEQEEAIVVERVKSLLADRR